MSMKLRFPAFCLINFLVVCAVSGQSEFIDSKRYLRIESQNRFGYSGYAEETTASPLDYYIKSISAAAPSGQLTASQNTNITPKGVVGTLGGSTFSSGSLEYSGSALSQLLVDYKISVPSKYRLVLKQKNTTDEGRVHRSTNAFVGLGVPSPTFVKSQYFALSRAVGSNVLPPAAGDLPSTSTRVSGDVEFLGVLDAGVCRLVLEIRDSRSDFGSILSSTSLAVDFEISAIQPVAITRQPVSKALFPGESTVLSVTATGDLLTYAWSKDDIILPSATSATLDLGPYQLNQAGRYKVTVTNPLESVGSAEAILTNANPGRLINLSILTSLSVDDPLFTVGAVVGGAGTAGKKNLIVRAAGPALLPFGVAEVLPDPKLDILKGSLVIAANDNWGGSPVLANAMTQVGAFTFGVGSSKDAAVAASLESGSYTIQITDSLSAPGTVIAELYDATPAATFTRSTPRLLNVSVLKRIPSGGSLTAGFVVGGSTTCPVLIRVIGPSLSAFGVSGAMADPQLALYHGQDQMGSNDNWLGDAGLVFANTSVGAFAPSSEMSKDAIMLVDLSPGSYTVQARGTGDSSGTALIEVYEVPR